jgi:hypothetical protein
VKGKGGWQLCNGAGHFQPEDQPHHVTQGARQISYRWGSTSRAKLLQEGVGGLDELSDAHYSQRARVHLVRQLLYHTSPFVVHPLESTVT